MPDIRDFFGGGGARNNHPSTPSQEKNSTPAKRKAAKRKVIEDSDDEDAPSTSKQTPEKKRGAPPGPSKRRRESPPGEVTTTSDYFQSTSKIKPKRSTPTKKNGTVEGRGQFEVQITPSKKRKEENGPTPAKSKDLEYPAPKLSAGRTSGRKQKAVSYLEADDDGGEDALEDADVDAIGDDVKPTSDRGGRKAHETHLHRSNVDRIEKQEVLDDDDEDFTEIADPQRTEMRSVKTTTPRKGRAKVLEPRKDTTMASEVDSDSTHPNPRKTVPVTKHVNGKKASATASKGVKRPMEDVEEDEDDLEIIMPGSKPSMVTKTLPPVTKSIPKKARPTAKKEAAPESKEIDDILSKIPTIRAPSPPPKSADGGKFNFAAHAARTATPAGAGTKEVPVGEDNCLAGQTFVFTGLLDSLGREEGIELVKRYGGHVTTAPSSKTSFVVLGNDAGPKKLETIKKLGLKTIDEDGLFELIRRLPANGGDSKAAQKNEEKKAKEELKIREIAAEMEKEELRAAANNAKAGSKVNKASKDPASSKSVAAIDNRLWTVKYAPSGMTQICGNKGQCEKLQRWLREWPNNLKVNFKKAGKDGSFNFRAIIIHGPPGIGKTTAAHLVAKMEGYDILESNASDTRSKKLVEGGLKGVLDNTSLNGYFASDEKKVDISRKKLVLIMDEVDGMSGGDRGGVGALAQVCRKTHIPMILICNDRRLPKMRPFDHVTYELPFRRPTANDIRSRIASICYREGLKLPPQVIDALIEGTHADIRQIINMISQAKLDQEALSFDQGKRMSKAWEKHIVLKPWDIAHKLLGTGMFGPTSNKSLNDKIELYFNDHEFSYLMIQENYLKTRPQRAQNYQGKEQQLKILELFDKAAESISDGDLVDRMIHGSQQQWSLMPTHAVFSTVRPASLIYGGMTGQASFTSWLGNNSKQGE